MVKNLTNRQQITVPIKDLAAKIKG